MTGSGPPRQHRGHRTPGAGDGGVALIEAALVLPLVVLLFLGVVEFGFAWRDVNRIERGLQQAGRVGSSLGIERFADYELLRAVDASMTGMTGASIERVVVFQASGSNGTVPAPCRTMVVSPTSTSAQGSSAARCNVYSPAQVARQSPSGFPDDGSGGCAGGSWDQFFCPRSRSNSGVDLTYLGVYIRAQYRPFTSLLPGPTLTVERTTVFRLEPCIPSVQSC